MPSPTALARYRSSSQVYLSTDVPPLSSNWNLRPRSPAAPATSAHKKTSPRAVVPNTTSWRLLYDLHRAAGHDRPITSDAQVHPRRPHSTAHCNDSSLGVRSDKQLRLSNRAGRGLARMMHGAGTARIYSWRLPSGQGRSVETSRTDSPPRSRAQPARTRRIRAERRIQLRRADLWTHGDASLCRGRQLFRPRTAIDRQTADMYGMRLFCSRTDTRD